MKISKVIKYEIGGKLFDNVKDAEEHKDFLLLNNIVCDTIITQKIIDRKEEVLMILKKKRDKVIWSKDDLNILMSNYNKSNMSLCDILSLKFSMKQIQNKKDDIKRKGAMPKKKKEIKEIVSKDNSSDDMVDILNSSDDEEVDNLCPRCKINKTLEDSNYCDDCKESVDFGWKEEGC